MYTSLTTLNVTSDAQCAMHTTLALTLFCDWTDWTLLDLYFVLSLDLTVSSLELSFSKKSEF